MKYKIGDKVIHRFGGILTIKEIFTNKSYENYPYLMSDGCLHAENYIIKKLEE